MKNGNYILRSWSKNKVDLTFGKIYTVEDGSFYDDDDDSRDTCWGEWEPVEYVEETFAPLTGTDKGVKLDDGKVEMSLLMSGCAKAINDAAKVLTFGAKKYTRNGWQTVEDAERRYTDALYRHMNAIHRGEKIDPESGLSHRSHVACNAMFLLELDND